MFRKCLILLWLSTCCCLGYNILVVFPHSAKSHFLAFENLFKALAQKGHNVTVISYFPQSDPILNYRDVTLTGPSLNIGTISIESVPTSWAKRYRSPLNVASFAAIDCPIGLQNSNLLKFLKEDNKFDVILAEVFNTNCFMGLVKKFDAPLIGLSSSVIMPWAADMLGSPYHPAYIPNIFLDYSDKLTFIERLENTLMFIYTRLVYKYKMEIPGNELSKKFLGQDLLKNGNFMYNMSLLLTNTHFSLNLPRPLPPADVEVGGIHIGKLKRLPWDVENWIDKSPEGVIYFSLGSLIKGDTFPKNKIVAFNKAFAKLPQRVLWKWENKSMERKPKNVMTQKWLPQLDVLCHPNVKAFISHGGLLETIEAVHCGVPVVVMPQFGDQHTNGKALEAVGGGVILKLADATEDTVYKALKTVLNPEFRRNVKILSEKFKDRPVEPLKTGIFWVEYVAKYNGAAHMRTAAVTMPFYKYYLVDVITVIVLIFTLFIYISYACIKIVIHKLFISNHNKTKVD